MSQETLAEAPIVQKSRRGFAAMSVEKRRAIAAKGGRSPFAGRPFLNKALARRAGRKGGKAPHRTRGKQPVPA